MTADLTCLTCKGGTSRPMVTDFHGHCAECGNHGRRPPRLDEWDALAAERDRYHRALDAIAFGLHDRPDLVARAALDGGLPTSQCCRDNVPHAGGFHQEGEVWRCPECGTGWIHVIEESEGAWWQQAASDNDSSSSCPYGPADTHPEGCSVHDPMDGWCR